VKKSFLVLLFLSLLFWFLDTKGAFNWLHKPFANLTNPARKSALLLTQGKLGEDQNQEAKIADLEFKIKQLEEENKSARRLLGADLSPKLKFIPAHVLGISKDHFILDQGSFGGILEDDLVLSGNILVGKVVKVNSFNSEAISLVSNDFRLAVGIWRREEGEEDLVGKGLLQGGTGLLVKEILPEEEIKKGDLVASLDQGGEFLVGEVISTDWDQNKVFKNATLKGLFNLRNLRTVMVVKQ